MSAAGEAEILIIGAGFSGMVMAIAARKAGFKKILILEKAADLGGTWRENHYPGVACDIPSHLYAFEGHPNPGWTRRYSGGAEIWNYMRDVARREGLCEIMRFGAAVTGAAWDATARLWRVETADGGRFTARVLVSAMGPLHVPKKPELPGLDRFEGEVLHSAEWDGSVDLSGRRVAVVGAGASASQLVPEVARAAGQMTLYQRSAPWVLPHFDYAVPRWMRWLYRHVPGFRHADRALTFAMQEMKHAVFRRDPIAAATVRRIALWHMNRAVRDTGLRRRLTPDYEIGCKRILLSNTWYPALVRPNVKVVTEGLSDVRPDSIVSDRGDERPADVLIFATGFRVTDLLANLPFRGRGGLALGDAWRTGVSAYLGSAVVGFPNLFFMLGPNTALGHNSIVLMAEAQAEHVVRVLREMRAAGTDAVEPKPSVHERYAADLQARLATSVWQAGGCTSWYKDATGRNPTIWPGTVRQFRRLARRSGMSDYVAV